MPKFIASSLGASHSTSLGPGDQQVARTWIIHTAAQVELRRDVFHEIGNFSRELNHNLSFGYLIV